MTPSHFVFWISLCCWPVMTASLALARSPSLSG
jgi:hypothetical protein